MVYKKYTWKKGKKYGPYFYESKRVGNRVVSYYLGRAKGNGTRARAGGILHSLLRGIFVLITIGFIIGLLGGVGGEGGGFGTMVFFDNGSSVQKVYDCGTLNTTDAVYTMNQSVNSTGTCFTILANNITLNGNGFLVNYSQGGGNDQYGVLISAYNYTTINNVTIEEGNLSGNSDNGIHLLNPSHNNTFSNNTIRTIGALSYGIRVGLVGSYSFNNIMSNTILVYNGSAAVSAVYIVGGTNNNITGNNMTLLRAAYNALEVGSEEGAYSTYVANNTIVLNSTGLDGAGILLDVETNYSIISGNIIYSNGPPGLLINYPYINISYNNISVYGGASGAQVGANTLLFSNYFFVNGSGHAIVLPPASNVTINFTTISVGSPNSNWIRLISGSLNGTLANSVFNSSHGNIRFLSSIALPSVTIIGSTSVLLGPTSAFVDSSDFDFMNVSANVTLYNVPVFGNPAILRDGVACPAAICKNLTSLNSGLVVFNVTGWSNYSIGDITTPGVTINFPANSTMGTLVTFNVTTNENVTTVQYSLNGGLNNVTMQNNGNRNFNASNGSIADGTYTVSFFANDTVNNFNNSESRVFSVDNANPAVTINSPLAQTYTVDNVAVNISLNENGNCRFSLNAGTGNTSMTSIGNVQFISNTPSFSNGDYTLNAYCNDTLGNVNNTKSVVFTISVAAVGGNGGGGGGGGGATQIPKKEECISEYSCDSWGICLDGRQARICSDVKCDGASRIENRACVIECAPDWSCGDWSACANGESKRTCYDKNSCGASSPAQSVSCLTDAVEDNLDEDVECKPDFACGDWGACRYDGKVGDIFEGKIKYVGFQERVCSDRKGCALEYSEEQNCRETVDLEFRVDSVCGVETLVALNAENKLPVTQVNLESWEAKRLDVSFVQGSDIQCSSCFNGIIDGNETGVDCGGDCRKCMTEFGIPKRFLVWPWWLLFLILVGYFLREEWKKRSFAYKVWIKEFKSRYKSAYE